MEIQTPDLKTNIHFSYSFISLSLSEFSPLVYLSFISFIRAPPDGDTYSRPEHKHTLFFLFYISLSLFLNFLPGSLSSLLLELYQMEIQTPDLKTNIHFSYSFISLSLSEFSPLVYLSFISFIRAPPDGDTYSRPEHKHTIFFLFYISLSEFSPCV